MKVKMRQNKGKSGGERDKGQRVKKDTAAERIKMGSARRQRKRQPWEMIQRLGKV